MSEYPSPHLRLDTVTGDDQTVVLVRGDIDAATAEQLLTLVEGIPEHTKRIEFDLAEVGFLDSTGIGVIAATLRRLEPVNGTLAMRQVPKPIIELLRITDLLDLVEIVSQRS